MTFQHWLSLFALCFISAAAHSQALFSEAQLINETTPGMQSLVVVDLDEDDDLDLLVITAQGEDARDLVWFENDGVGQFAAAQPLLSGLPPKAHALSVADLDADGDVDFVFGDATLFGNGGLYWAPNEGRQAGAIRVINPFDCGIFRTADFDGDGDIDVIQGGYAVKLYENTGNSDDRFRYAYTLAKGPARALAISDFDQDGDSDLVGSQHSYERFNDIVHYHEQREPGSLFFNHFGSELVSFTRELQMNDRFISIAEAVDVDGDEAKDLVIGGYISDDTPPNEGFVYWYRNQGGENPLRDTRIIARAPRIGDSATWGVDRIAVVDFDKDGDRDVALVRLVAGADSLFWYENPGLENETAVGWEAHSIGEVDFRVLSLESADINGDGAVDLVSIEGTSIKRLLWYENLNSTGTGSENVETELHQFEIRSIWPNPSSGAITVTYQLAQPVRVQLEVFDMLGRVVATVLDEMRSAGTHRAEFDASHLPSGTYVYRLTAGDLSQTKSIVLTK